MANRILTAYTPIAEFQLGDEIRNVCYAANIKLSKTKAGKPYLEGQLRDRDSSIDFRLWDYNGPFDDSDSGQIICVTGSIGDYNGRLQANLQAIRAALPMDKYDVENLVPSAPIDAEVAFSLMRDRVKAMSDPDYQALANAILTRHGQALRNLPAAKSVHHAFVHGLLMHTGTMLSNAIKLAASYPEVINKDLLIVGVLAHDIAKSREFELSPLGLVTNYTIEGNLLGHLVMGYAMINDLADGLNIPAEKLLQVQHMVVSHHGEPEYGAAARPQSAEAIMLNMLDQLDSKMEAIREEFLTMEPGTISSPVIANNGQRVYKPSWVGVDEANGSN